MSIIKKYWWCWLILAFIAIPIILNAILLIPAFTPIVGTNTVWLSFWGSLIGALASFAMIVYTAKSLEQNRLQLNELKRQWNEEHSPYLSCQLVVSGDYFKLRVYNSASVVADNVSIGIENYLIDTDIYRFDKLKDFLSSHSFVIPPYESIYFDILITAFKDIENLPQGYIEVSMKSSKKDFGKFLLYPCNYAFISFEKENIGNAIVESISKVSKTIENKRYLFK